jgi:hypothetical protein
MKNYFNNNEIKRTELSLIQNINFVGDDTPVFVEDELLDSILVFIHFVTLQALIQPLYFNVS